MSIEFNKIPKIENHLHLEGAIPVETVWQLIQKYGGDKSVANVGQLKDRFVFRDFNHFIETWSWKNQYLREYEDFVLITDAVLRDIISQNVKYAEIFISPSLFKDRLQIQRIVESVAAGITKNPGIKVNLIVDLVRNYGAEEEMKTLYEINEVKHLGIKGIGIGGSEKEYPPELFADIYNKARDFGFRTTCHAGEAAGPESIWAAINLLKPERIGHGTAAVHDIKLMEYLSDSKIPVELCPLSNLRTKVIEKIEHHPVAKYIEYGIPVSINTDDPKMFGNSLAEEYQVLRDVFGFSDTSICKIITDSVYTTWLPLNEMKELEILLKKEMSEVITL